MGLTRAVLGRSVLVRRAERVGCDSVLRIGLALKTKYPWRLLSASDC